MFDNYLEKRGGDRHVNLNAWTCRPCWAEWQSRKAATRGRSALSQRGRLASGRPIWSWHSPKEAHEFAPRLLVRSRGKMSAMLVLSSAR